MRTWQEATTSAPGRLDRLVHPLSDAAHRMTRAIGDAQDRLAGARDDAGEAVAAHPLRWTVAAFVGGLVIGALVAYRRIGY